ncbi:FHA domain-containing protein [Gloeothece citriformis]|nr:FHA domain-containing protein [Gloeothece citriformis]
MTDQAVQPEKEHCLIIQDDKGRRVVRLSQPVYSLGRFHDCDIRLRSQFVSRHHATLICCFTEEGESFYRIIDGDAKGKISSNGLRINGRKVLSYDLKHGDKIVFGPQVIAVYEYRQRDQFPTQPNNDPFDITLIDPAMMMSDDDEPTQL